MSDRKQARAMDLPGYPCPPTLGQIATHAGSWGWFWASARVGQDLNGDLWVDSVANLSPKRRDALATWTEDGIALFVPPSSYGQIVTIQGALESARWVPVASILKEPPAYSLEFGES
jgi:hypothetical protein